MKIKTGIAFRDRQRGVYAIALIELMKKPAFYLDYAASAPMKPAVRKAVMEALDGEGNASSVHGFGRAQRARMEMARQNIADIMEVKPAEVVFTSGATEANITALHATAPQVTIVSSIEHPSILQSVMDPVRVRTRPDGLVDLGHFDECLGAAGEDALVSIMLVNNETGVIQPVAEMAKRAKAKGAVVHCDAAQAVGRVPFTRASLGVDMLSLSAHKIGGPQGVGALIIREGLVIRPLFTGGGQEMRRRSGTENVAGIAGFGVAMTLASEDISQQPLWAAWRDAFEDKIVQAAPGATIFGHAAPRAGCFSCLAMPGVKNETQLMALDLEGFAVSAGSACSSGKVQASPVLKAMGTEEILANSALRITFGWNTKEQELQHLADSWIKLYNKASARAA